MRAYASSNCTVQIFETQIKRLLGVIFKSLFLNPAACTHSTRVISLRTLEGTLDPITSSPGTQNPGLPFSREQRFHLPGTCAVRRFHPVFWERELALLHPVLQEPALSHPGNEALGLANTEQRLLDACYVPTFASILHASSVLKGRMTFLRFFRFAETPSALPLLKQLSLPF